jgi:transposase
MIADAIEVRLSRKDRAELEARIRGRTTAQRDVFRARIVLLAAKGRSTRSIARELNTMPRTVSLWRGRYAREGLAGLEERPRSGPKPKYGRDAGERILAVLDRPPPAGFGRWTAPLIAKELTDVHEQYIWRYLRAGKIHLDRSKSWCESNDPEFGRKAADVVGLYLAPPENAIVLCVDEKPSIQALERAQGYLKLPNGRTLSGHSHDYTRNGTTTLFAALEVATGKVTAVHKRRRRRVEFLDFMNRVVSAYPDRELHVVLDNLSTHKPKNDQWLKRHPNVRFHFTPTRASWLNQVEVWFSILEGKSLKGASFTSVPHLQEHIDAFIATYNREAVPFSWTKKRVRQRRFKNRRISQL